MRYPCTSLVLIAGLVACAPTVGGGGYDDFATPVSDENAVVKDLFGGSHRLTTQDGMALRGSCLAGATGTCRSKWASGKPRDWRSGVNCFGCGSTARVHLGLTGTSVCHVYARLL